MSGSWGNTAKGKVAGSSGKGGWGNTANGPADAQVATQPKPKDRSVLGAIGHTLEQGATDLKDVALNAPAGLAALGAAGSHDTAAAFGHLPGASRYAKKRAHEKSQLLPVAKATAHQYLQDLEHPLRHPGLTLLDVLPFVGTAGKLAEAGRAARAGEAASVIAKTAIKGAAHEPRTVNVGGLEVRGHYSRAAGSRVVQRATDRLLEKGAKRGVGVSAGRREISAESLLHGRAAKWMARNERVAAATARAPGTRLAVLGSKLQPHELRALRLVAEEAPVERRLAAQQLRKARASSAKEIGRHQERIDLTQKAMQFLDEGPDGKPVFKPTATKLARVYDALKAASTDREHMLENVGLLDKEAAQAAKTNTARVAAGAEPPQAAGRAFAKRLRGNRAGLVDEYVRRFGSEVNTDKARELSPHYSASPESRARLAAEVHEPASATAKAVYAKLLEKPAERDSTVTFTAGGTGAGKSTGFVGHAGNDIVFDTNMNKLSSAVTKIEQALQSGRNVHVAYTYRDPVDALRGMLHRAHRTEGEGAGRVVPLHEHVRTHVGASKVIRQLVERYRNDPRVQFGFIDNTRGKGQLRQASLDQLPVLRHSEVRDAVRSAYEQEVAAGRVKPFVREALARAEARREGLGAGDRGQSERGVAAGRADRLVGAEDLTASPNAVHIGNPVERTRLAGRPRFSSTGTFGKTRKPGSLKAATGGAVEHALERNDVTNIAAERHAEAVRLSTIDRVRTQLAKAGSAVPRRRDDIFVRTGDLVKQEKLPHEVRSFLENPESLAELPEPERLSVIERLRQATFATHDWHVDAEARAEFEQLAKQGKGVFIPRRLAGAYAKQEITLPGSRFIDQVNNAQKAGLIYLKVNYPVVQGVSNLAMNVIHQGFAYPRNLTAAIRLEHRVGPEYAAITDDVMGEGAVVQAQFEGQGAVARGSQKLAHVMSSKVDRPARRAAFYHEAIKAGYDTPEKYRALLEAPEHAGDLAEVAQRAKEAIVDYGELGPRERAIVRRLIFVYPWQKGATKYAGHFLRDHPVQAAVLGNVGELGAQQSNQQLGPTPSYLQGAFTAGGGLVNPSGVNFFQTPAQIGEGLAGIATGNPATPSGQDFLAPLPGLAVAALTRKDGLGFPLPKNPLAALRDLTVGQTPAAQLAYAATGGRSKPVLGGRGPSKTFPGANDALWRFLLGGLYPRQFDKAALNANAAREKTGR